MSLELGLYELKKRLAPYLIYDSLFTQQQDVVDSGSRFKSILTPRRAAKSWTICCMMIIQCLKVERSRCLYLGLTRTSVKRIAWDILTRVLKDHNVSFKANKIELTIYFENGSMIELGGADSTVDAAEKYLGAAYDIVAIDEAGSFTPTVLDYLIDTVISPTLIDRRGTLVLAGTPRAIEAGRFYLATTTDCPRWRHFSWDTSKNPYMKENWLAEIEKLKELNPNIVNEAWFIREYMGKWCKDTSDLVYKFDPALNLISKLPDQTYNYILGVDIGWNDQSAFVVSGSAKNDDNLYVIESYKKSEMLPDDIARQIEYYQKQYQPLYIVADGQNKTVIEELKRRHSLPISAAKKTNKQDWIEIINGEFLIGKIKILQSHCAGLIGELSNLPWHTKPNGGREEHPAFDNHETDSLLYNFRFSYHYKNIPKETPTQQEQIYQDQVRKARRQLTKKRWER